MSNIPDEIPDCGNSNLKPRQNPEFVPGNDFGTEEYYVWSQCDGKASIKDLILMLGLGNEKSISILGTLRKRGALLLPGETRVAMPEIILPRSNTGSIAPDNGTTTATISLAIPPSGLDLGANDSVLDLSDTIEDEVDLGEAQSEKEFNLDLEDNKAPTISSLDLSRTIEQGIENAVGAKPLEVEEDWNEEEGSALQSNTDLTIEERKRVLLFRRKVAASNYFELLDVSIDADKRMIKRSYFQLSKDFHPDRYYGKELGVFGPWLSEAFKSITNAFKTLGNKKKRKTYQAALGGGEQVAQTKEEHAQSLFESACEYELHGDAAQALKLFAACIRMDEKAKHLRRAAMCALAARELSVAEEYAKNAVELQTEDPSYLRVLSDVYRAGKRLKEAKALLLKALDLKTENDSLFGELQADLAAVSASLESQE